MNALRAQKCEAYNERRIAMPLIIAWLLGVPLGLIIILWLVGVGH